jgi:hypothetical protein
MTSWPQGPTESVQVPQVVGLTPDVAYAAITQAGLVPMFQVRAAAGQPLPGVATQWGQVPVTFTGQPVSAENPSAQVVTQSPAAGAWAQRGSVVYAQWVEVIPVPERHTSYAGWIVAGVLTVLLVVGALAWLITGGAMPEPPVIPTTSPSP